MEAQELKRQLKAHLGIEQIHPLYEAVFDEVTEDVAALSDEYGDKIKLSIYNLNPAIKILRRFLASVLDSLEADTLTLNYRGQRFEIHRDDPLLKQME